MSGRHLDEPAGGGGRGWLAFLAVLIALGALGLAWLYTRADPVTAAAAPSGRIDRTAAALAAERAEGESCQRLVAQVTLTAGRLDHQFHLHHQAHKLMLAGKITEEERNRIWATTLAARAELSPLLQRSIKAATEAGCA